MSEVRVEPCASYEADRLDTAVEAVLRHATDGREIWRGCSTVLLKPNFVAPRAAETAVTTDPRFLAAVVRAVRRRYGGRLLLGDSPAVSTASSVARRLGLPRLLEGYDVEIVDFRETVKVPGGGGFGPFDLARPLAEADVVINLPKVKTHAQMALTLGVKNLYGAFVGLAKVHWHLHAGRDESVFARLLIELERRIAPALTLADAVVGMEGNGPTAGRPRVLGWIAASTDTLALDFVLADLLGYRANDVPLLREAIRQGLPSVAVGRSALKDPSLSRFRVAHWTPARPQACDATWIPRWIARPLRHPLTTRPVFDHGRCTRCGECLLHCGPGALSFAQRAALEKGPGGSDRQVAVDLDRCIRCYCCQEVCPQGAIAVGEGTLLRWTRRLLSARRSAEAPTLCPHA